MGAVSIASGSQRRVSCTIGIAWDMHARWRRASNSSAAWMPENEFMFLISTFVPSCVAPTGRIEMLTSLRMLPSSRLQSLTPA